MIEARNLTKKFDDIMAVDHINATIRDGCVFGFIGTNGAGKSTFLKIIMREQVANSGTVVINNYNLNTIIL